MRRNKEHRKASVVERVDDDEFEQNLNPFPEEWMNNCYRRLTFPNESCIQVMESVYKFLPKHLSKPQRSQQKQQALFLLLGKDFTEHFFPNYKYDEKLLEPPKMTIEQRKKYLEEIKPFVRQGVVNALIERGYGKDVGTYEDKDDVMGKFIKEVKRMFREGFSLHSTVSTGRNNNVKNNKRNYDRNNKSLTMDAKNEYEGNPVTNVAGKSFLQFMNYDNFKRNKLRNLIFDKRCSLPASLRNYFWWQILLEKKNTKSSKNDNVKSAVVNEFQTKLKGQMKKLNIHLAVSSPNADDIQRYTLEAYESSSPLRNMDNDDFLINSIRLLNIMDIHSSNYTPIHSFLMFPISMAFSLQSNEDEEVLLSVAAFYHLFVKDCQLNQKEIFSLSQDVISTLRKEDPEYLEHIEKCLNSDDASVTAKDFIPEVLTKDLKSALQDYKTLFNEGLKSEKFISKKYAQILRDPCTFIRKWIGQVFVGILSINGLLWTWDQIFLSNWSRDVVQKLALSVISLIKPWINHATDYNNIRKVLLEEPSKLYTSDLRAAFTHLEQGGSFEDIPKTKNYIERKLDSPTFGNGPSKRRHSENGDKVPRRGRITVPIIPFDPKNAFEVDINLESDPEDEPQKTGEPHSSARKVEPTIRSIVTPEPSKSAVSVKKDEPSNYAPSFLPESRPPTPTTLDDAWVLKKEDEDDPVEIGTREPFDMYIDYVRFLPDNVSICKVEGRLINSQLPKKSLGKIIAYPRVRGFQRSPAFKYKIKLNPNSEKMNSACVIMFKVYGYQRATRDVAVVGSCLLEPFRLEDGDDLLKVGGHQMRLRHGIPKQVEKDTLEETDLDNNYSILACSLCVRLLAPSKKYESLPRYEDGFYDSYSSELDSTEILLSEHYTSRKNYRIRTVQDELEAILKAKRISAPSNEKESKEYIKQLLDHSSYQKRKLAVPNLDYSHFVLYESKYGMNICIQNIFALPESCLGYYIHIFAEVICGKRSEKLASPGERENLRFVTKKLNLNSPQLAPEWLDLKTKLHPPLDNKSILLFQLYGIKPRYTPVSSELTDTSRSFWQSIGDMLSSDATPKEAKGHLESKDGGEFHIDYNEPLIWAALPLFNKNYTQAGLHAVSVFKGSPNLSVLSQFEREGDFQQFLKKSIARGQLPKPESKAFMEVEIWDGHLDAEDLPEPLINNQLLTLGIDTKPSEKGENSRILFSDMVLENMSEEKKALGSEGEYYTRHSYNFQDEANQHLFDALNAALKRENKPPLDLN